MLKLQARTFLKQTVHENNQYKLELWGQAEQLFQQSYRQGQWSAIRSKLTGKPNGLLRTTDPKAAESMAGRYDKGVQVVPIDQIRGSENRTGDFDRDFNPRQKWTRQRWINIAMASIKGITLPPVKLTKIGETYFVQDGHHRISVARALGQTYVDAEVSIWQVR